MGSEQAIVKANTDEPFRHLITVEEFLVLDEAGVFDEVERHVELIEGEIFVMAPLHLPHSRTSMELTIEVGMIVRGLPGIEALTPVSARLERHSLPEADIIIADVVADADQDFVTPRTLRLLVEVSASSLAHDLGRKLRLYARTGVPEYWVADVAGKRIVRMHAPDGEAYTQVAEFAFGDPVSAATIPGLVVDTARLR